ncbi:hypothetical protein ARMGADRAFT_1131151 [Armillaria gallica]|uniref:Uncharacterized protein n=1 Tax=Armillaria gallica TaxID=47427 RepID=A0A2H3DU55_ARMGA|nr:hypothetical protein ARMGADRAFT_1131151 [Armillaria gallica]
MIYAMDVQLKQMDRKAAPNLYSHPSKLLLEVKIWNIGTFDMPATTRLSGRIVARRKKITTDALGYRLSTVNGSIGTGTTDVQVFFDLLDLKFEPFVPHVEFERGQASGAVVVPCFYTFFLGFRVPPTCILASHSCLGYCRSVINFSNTWVPCPSVGDILVTLPATLPSDSIFPQPEVTPSAASWGMWSVKSLLNTIANVPLPTLVIHVFSNVHRRMKLSIQGRIVRKLIRATVASFASESYLAVELHKGYQDIENFTSTTSSFPDGNPQFGSDDHLLLVTNKPFP